MSATIYAPEGQELVPDDSPAAVAVRGTRKAVQRLKARLPNSAPRLDPVTGEPWVIYTPYEALELRQLEEHYKERRGQLRIVSSRD